MVRRGDSFLVDTTFIVESVHSTFLGAPLLQSSGRDRTFTFGFARDALRIRHALGIRKGMLVIGGEAHSAVGRQNVNSIAEFLRELRVPYISDSRRSALELVSSYCPQFTHIVTTDRRQLRLCTEDVSVVMPRKGARGQYDCLWPGAVKTLLGVGPVDVPTYLAVTEGLGASGLTGRQAMRLVEFWGDLDGVYNHLTEITSRHVRDKLVEGENAAREYYTRARATPGRSDRLRRVENASLRLDTSRARRILKRYGFHSLLPLLPVPPSSPAVRPPVSSSGRDYQAVADRAGLQALRRLIEKSKVCALDTEADDKDPRKAALLGVSFSVREGEGYYVPVTGTGIEGTTRAESLRFLKRTLASDTDFIGHNLKYDCLLLRRNGIEVRSVHFDTMLAAYDCYGDLHSFSLGHLSQRLLGREVRPYATVVKEGTTLLDLPFNELVDYACEHADVALRLYQKLAGELKERELTRQYHSETMPLLRQLIRLEFKGVRTDGRKLGRIRKRLSEQAERVKHGICSELGTAADLHSDNELIVILSDKLGLTGLLGQKRIRGAVLERTAIGNPLVRRVAQYRRLRKELARVEAVLKAVDHGRAYPLFSLASSPAGLVGATGPRLFDIEAIPEFASCFDKDVRGLFWEEARAMDTLAKVTGDPLLIRRRSNRATKRVAKLAYRLPDDVDYDEFLLRTILGDSDDRLSRRFLIDHEAVRALRDSIKREHGWTLQWLEDYRRQAEAKGFAVSDGRRKYLDGLWSSNLDKRRKALNHVVGWLIKQ